MGLDDALLDDSEELRKIPDDNIIWEGVPVINENIYKGALIVLIASIVISFLYITAFYKEFTDTFLIIVISTGSIYFMTLGVFIIMLQDYYSKKRKAKYVLQRDKLIVRDGNKLVTKNFLLTDLEKVIRKKKSKHVTIVLKYPISNPFTLNYERTKEIKIGPFHDPEEIVGIINEQILK